MTSSLALNQATLLVRDVEANKALFLRMGFKLIVDEPPRYARFELPGSARSTLSLLDLAEEGSSSSTAQGNIELFLELPSKQELDEYCAQLGSNGVEFLELPTDRDYLWREARVKMPEGHDVRLYFAGENRLYPPWRAAGEEH